MKFSYFVDNQCLLKSINLPIMQGTVFLITGKENLNFNLLGGIISRLFPLDETIDLPQIQQLIENYTGTLEIEEGMLPKNPVYVGADPDRHLLFATVLEEMLMRVAQQDDFAFPIAQFDLDSSFVKRQIATLSGGEKMKVALAIAFTSSADCYVLHGVIPWLDKKGRELLFAKIEEVKKGGATILFLEHEVAPLLEIVDEILEFDGGSLNYITKPAFYENYLKKVVQQKPLALFGNITNNPIAPILKLQKVTLKKHAFSEQTSKTCLLKDISFTLKLGKSYLMVGENGAGKSTIAQLIFRVFKYDTGVIFFQNRLITEYTRKELNNLICYVGQFTARQITQGTVWQTRAEAQQNNNQLAIYLLDKYLNVPNDQPVSRLSFLQLKILCLINSISADTKLIILDEPSWGIDQEGRQLILCILEDIAQHINFALLIISHDLSLGIATKAEILWLNNGKLSNFVAVDEFIADNQVKHNFDTSLVENICTA